MNLFKRVAAAALASATVMTAAVPASAVTAKDALNLLKRITSKTTTAADDYNKDGKVNAKDVLAMIKDVTGGSSSGGGSTTKLKDADSTLTILTWGANADAEAMVNEFCKKTGTSKDKIKIAYLGNSSSDFANAAYDYINNTPEDADILMTSMDGSQHAVFLDANKMTAPLSTIGITEKSFPDAYDFTFNLGKDDKGALKAVAYNFGAGGFVYNAKLAKQYLGVNSPSEMQAKVKDWATFEKTAAELVKASGGKTKLCLSIGFLFQAYKMGKKDLVDYNNYVLDDTSAKEFLNMTKRYIENGYCANMPAWSNEYYFAFNDGKALGEFMPSWILGSFMLQNYTQGASDYAICEGPEAFFWGVNGLALSSKCNTKATAKKFIEFVCGDKDGVKAVSGIEELPNNKKAVSEVIASGKAKISDLGGQDFFKVLDAAAKKIKYKPNKEFALEYLCEDALSSVAQKYTKEYYYSLDDALDAFKIEVVKYYDITVS